MSFNYTVSNFVSILKNSALAPEAELPYNKISISMLNALGRAGYIKDFNVVTNQSYKSIVVIKFFIDSYPILSTLQVLSKPGRRVYKTVAELKKIHLVNANTFLCISTSRGVKSLAECLNDNIGGEVLFSV